jgi:group I intron endonuclease
MVNNNNNKKLFVPVIIYNNANTDKSRILSDNKGKTGIYLWTHNESGKIYVGSAHDLLRRLRDYFNPSKLKEWDNYISKALIHHTHSAFSLAILEFIDISNLSKEEARKLIISREQYYLDLIFSSNKPNTYNLLKIAGSMLGFNHSAETIAKISGENNHFFGKIHTEETKALLSEINKGEKHPFFGFTHSAETKSKMSEAQKRIDRTGKNHPMYGITGENNPMFGISLSNETITKMSIARGGGTIYVYDLQGTLVNSFSSARKAAEFFNCHHPAIVKHMKSGKLFQDKWILSSSKRIIDSTPPELV